MKPLRAILRHLLRREQAERELEAELRAHVEMQAEANRRAGMSEAEARRQALLELGGVEQVKEQVREVRPGARLETLWQDVRYGLRMLRKNSGFTTVAVATLALGIGANTAIFSVVNGVLLRPLPFPEPERIVSIRQTSLKPERMVGSAATTSPGGRPIPVSPPNFADFGRMSESLAVMGASATSTRTLTGGEPERAAAAMVTAGYLDALGVPPLLGRVFAPEDMQPGVDTVVLGYGIWQRRFGGDRGIVGRRIPVNGRPHTVLGVMPRGFAFPDGAELWTPLVFAPGEMEQRNSHYLDVLARLAPGVSLPQARSELETIARRLGELHPQSNADFGVRLRPLQEELVGDVRPALVLLLGAVGFVLLIACANVAHLLLARAAGRQRELAVRSALGAGRARLVRQLLTESVLLGLLGGALGVALAFWVVDALRAAGPAEVPRLGEVAVDGWVLLFALGASLVTGVAFGAAPALRAARFDPQDALKEGARSSPGTSHRRLRRGLVVGEVALSLVLLAGAGLMVRTLWRLVTTDPGFDPHGVLTAEVYLSAMPYFMEEHRRTALASEVLERIAALPGVEAAGITNRLPLAGSNMTYAFLIEGRARPEGEPIPAAGFRTVSPDYLELMRVPLLRGRGITARDTAESPDVVVINEALAQKYWPGEDPLGRRIRIARGRAPAWRTIVGMVGDVRHSGLHLEPRPEMYVPYAQQPLPYFRLAVRTAGDPLALARPVQEAVWAADPDLPVSRIRSMTAVVSGSIAERRFYGVLLGTFAALALVLAAVGLYGTLAYGVAERRHEIGVRMALGARPGDVFRMVVGQGVALAAAGTGLGLAGAAALTRYLKNQLHGVEPLDPATFLAVAALLLLVAAVACWVPARRAAGTDPMAALRHE